ncbi:MAG: PAS domain-containing protein [Phycisphaerales bacterium]|nr:PAS domain-containing protein [Phycisphaerales bacterium]
MSAHKLMDIFAEGFSSLSLIVLTLDGTIVYANAVATKGFTGVDKNTIKGKHLTELTPPGWANERIRFMQRAAQTGKSIPMIDLIAGTRLYTTLRPIEIEHNGQNETLIFITVEPISSVQLHRIRKKFADGELIAAEHIDLGRLSVLTPREIEVLALMGLGLRQKDIANKLCRSVSTIDRHRERIGNKLGITDRADLIALAREAALEVEDAKRIHVSLKPKKFKPNSK